MAMVHFSAGDRIVAACAQRVATADPAQSHGPAAQDTMSADGLAGVFRTGGKISAAGRHERADRQAIEADEKDD